MGDEQQVQICRIVEAKNGQSATAEGSSSSSSSPAQILAGPREFKKSVHWQRGLVLDDDYGAGALLEHVGNDVRITVRVAYPEHFLAALTREVK